MDIFNDLSWLYDSAKPLVITSISTVIIYLAIMVITRINGLRTFAKMSSFDFAITIAIGSLIASTIMNDNISISRGVVALGALIALQALVAKARKRSDRIEKAITNTPVLLMDGSHILHENLTSTRVTEADLFAKLREANVYDLNHILAVVLETTGDISVLHSSNKDAILDSSVLKNVTELRD